MAVNAAHSRYRRRAAERRARRRFAQRRQPAVADPDAAEAIAIRREVAALPSRQARVLVLRSYLGLSVADTACWMECSEAAVKSLTLRAVGRLRNRFGLEAETADVEEADDVSS